MTEEKLIEANTKLVDENRLLKKDIFELERRIRKTLEIIEKYKKYNVIPLELEETLKGEK